MLLRLRVLAAAALLVVAGSALVAAQEQGGSIQGIVKDSSGGVLPGVTIEARSPSAVGVNIAVTDNRGEYRFPALPAGTYDIKASLPGFGTKELPDTQLQLGQLLKVDITLQVATVAESVLVTAVSPIIDVKQNAASASIRREIIDLIPKGRDFTSVVTTAPGANDENKAGGLQIDGSSGSENRFIVDGMDATALRTGLSNKTVYTDFLQEVQVKSSGYAAEYGGSTGGVISAITKSGGNDFRGSGGTYFRSTGLRGPVRPIWRINSTDNVTAEFVTHTGQNTPSATNPRVGDDADGWINWNPIADLGGPIVRDKIWFYGAYSRNDNRMERTATFRNSPAPYTTKTFNWTDSSDFLNWNVSSQLNRSMRLKVAGGNTRSRNRGGAPALQPNGSKFADGSPTDGFTTAAWDADPDKFKDRWERIGSNNVNDLYSANLDWVVTQKYFINVAGGSLRYDTTTPQEFAGTQLIHSFGGTNICTGAPGSSTCPFPEIPTTLQFVNTYSDNKSTSRTVKDEYTRLYLNANNTWYKTAKGEHIAKVGVRFERLGNDVNSGSQKPTITLNWNQARTTLDGRVVRGKYGYYTINRAYTAGTVTSNNWSFWAQDSWTIASKLTINAGVRTENEHVPSYRAEDPGIEFGFRDKIAPRIGFAYDVLGNSSWKAYGSFGKYYDITKLEMPRGSFGAEHSVNYYYTLETFDWPNLSCTEGPTGCPGTYIEQNDLRHPANAVDDKLTAYFGRPQNTIDPNIQPVETGELTFGVDHEISHSMSVGARYTHKWLTRTIEDNGISVPGVGEVFFIANPGFGLAEQILPPPAPPAPHAIRDYDGLELRLQKRLSNSWSLNTSYLFSRLYGNYGGLASSDENGRTSPNVDRYFDALYMSYDASGSRQPVLGLLATDRPHQFKTQLTYTTRWGTSVGVDGFVETGAPVQSQLSWRGFPVYFKGRGDLGRLPTYSQLNLVLQHDVKLPNLHRFNINVNITNVFDQKISTNINNTPYRDSFNVPGLNSDASNAYFFNGFDPAALAAQIRATNGTMRPNPLFNLPSSYQGRREIRLGMKYTF
jgi:Carboxypeptidase regulatory-like domain/TonB dependent receptor